MGKLLLMLEKIRKLDDSGLLDRLEHLIRAQAVREYLAMPTDEQLILEIRLSKEEMLKRLPVPVNAMKFKKG